jgi:hypothetical protein
MRIDLSKPRRLAFAALSEEDIPEPVKGFFTPSSNRHSDRDTLRHCLECSSPPGAVVLDPFMGAGSSGVAALSSGRHFIGIEQDQALSKMANDRLRGKTESVCGDCVSLSD